MVAKGKCSLEAHKSEGVHVSLLTHCAWVESIYLEYGNFNLSKSVRFRSLDLSILELYCTSVITLKNFWLH